MRLCIVENLKFSNDIKKNFRQEKRDMDIIFGYSRLGKSVCDWLLSLGKKDIAKALVVLKNLIYAKEPLQKILITLYNHFKKLYFVKLALRYNKDIVSSLNLKPNQTFLVSKYKTQANYFSENELQNILQDLRDLDCDYKVRVN